MFYIISTCFCQNFALFSIFKMFDLYAAVEKGDLKTIEYLISHGANIESKDKYGFTPLHIASIHNYLPIVEYLVSHGANIESKENNGASSLHYASQKDYLSIVEYLISHGSCILYRHFYIHDPLIYSPQVNEYLLFKIDDLNWTSLDS